nr:myelin basic protein-like [Paramormyrops kingsleyae]
MGKCLFVTALINSPVCTMNINSPAYSDFVLQVSPPPPKSKWRGLSAKLGRGEQKSTQAGRSEGQGTLSRIFKMGGSRSGSPAKR